MSINNNLNNQMTDYQYASNNNSQKRKMLPPELINSNARQKQNNNNNNNNANNSVVNGNLLSPPPQNNNNTLNNPVSIKDFKCKATIACGLNKSIQLVGSLDEIISEIANRSILKGDGCLMGEWRGTHLKIDKGGRHIHFKVEKGCVFGFEGEAYRGGVTYTGQFARAKCGLAVCGLGKSQENGFVSEGEYAFLSDTEQNFLLNGKCFYNGPIPRPQFPDSTHWIGTVKNGRFEGFFEILGPEWRLTGENTNSRTVLGKKWFKFNNTVSEGEFKALYPHADINTQQTYIGEMPPKKVVILANFENGKMVVKSAILPNGCLVTHIREFNGTLIGKKETASDGQIMDNKLEGNWVKFIKCGKVDTLTYDGLFKNDEFTEGTIYTPEGLALKHTSSQ